MKLKELTLCAWRCAIPVATSLAIHSKTLSAEKYSLSRFSKRKSRRMPWLQVGSSAKKPSEKLHDSVENGSLFKAGYTCIYIYMYM